LLKNNAAYDAIVTYKQAKQPKQVLITASFTADLLATPLDWWLSTFLLSYEIAPYKTEFSPYNQIFAQLADNESQLNQNTDINVVLIRLTDWLRDSPGASLSEQQKLINNNSEYFVSLLQSHNGKGKLFIGFLPFENDNSELNQYLTEQTTELSSSIDQIPGVSLLNVNDPFGEYGLVDALDAEQNRIGHIPYAENGFNCLGAVTARALCGYLLPAFKVLVLDCDNTLWQGVVGEDGPLGVQVTAAHKSFQQKVLDKYNSGFLLAIASKNNAADVWEVFDKHPDMILKKHHFAASQIHWEPKSQSMQALAQELNLGLSSFIFFDDSAMECSEVMPACPEVLTVQFPLQGENIDGIWQHLWALDQFRVTDEDRNRNNMVRADVARKQSEQQANSGQVFTNNLDLKIEVCALDAQSPKSAWERASQLTYRTN
ncbi:MAG: HAD-IIIC family phosphatase, partial [Psychrosphaera sp.]|nr:HAD-IIIC family phosphatase [Psychrosphaera sp.]